jgi:tetratricopeptide (TPR) repeat protein
LARAVELLNEARGSADRLVAADQRDLRARLAAADIYACLGAAAQARHEPDAAIQWFESSNKIVTPAFELQPNDATYRRRYAMTLACLAGVYADAGDSQRAARAYELYLSASEPLFIEQIEQAPLRAYAWHAVGREIQSSDPTRAAECFQRGLDDLARLEKRRSLNDYERGIADDLRNAAAGAPEPQPQQAP